MAFLLAATILEIGLAGLVLWPLEDRRSLARLLASLFAAGAFLALVLALWSRGMTWQAVESWSFVVLFLALALLACAWVVGICEASPPPPGGV